MPRFVDKDRVHIVPGFIDMLIDGRGRDQGDFVLGRAAAEEQGDSNFVALQRFQRDAILEELRPHVQWGEGRIRGNS